MRHAAAFDEAGGIIAQSAVLPVNDKVRQFENFHVFGDQQMPFAAIDKARCAGDAGQAHAARQLEIGNHIDARRQEDRLVGRRRIIQNPLEHFRLVIKGARTEAKVRRVDRAAQIDIVQKRLRRCRSRQGQGAGGGKAGEKMTSVHARVLWA